MQSFYVEDLDPAVVRKLMGSEYKGNYTYQLYFDKYEQCVVGNNKETGDVITFKLEETESLDSEIKSVVKEDKCYTRKAYFPWGLLFFAFAVLILSTWMGLMYCLP